MIYKTISLSYGVLNAKGSIYFSPDCGESITYNGELIIMTAISIFERFVSNNIKFYSESDMIDYITKILDEKYSCEDDDYEIRFNISYTKDDLLNYFNEHYYVLKTQKLNTNKLDEDSLVYKLLSKLSDYELNRVYYKNNLLEFIEHCYLDDGEDKMSILDYYEILFETEFLNPNKPSEYQLEYLNAILDVVKDYVFYNYQNFNKYDECHRGIRKAILTVDTDSTFIFLDKYYQYFKKKFPDLITADNAEKCVTVIDSITYLLTYVINQTYLNLTESCNIPEEFRSRINMKNEFLIQKILLTKNKKNYAYIMRMQEGNLIENPKLKIVGLPIKKVSYNKYVREYFQDILDNDILRAEIVDYSVIIGKYFKLTDIIEKSLMSGSTDYAEPCKVNEVETYKAPYNIMSVRGTLLWNILFPEEEVAFPNKLNMFKLNLPKDYDSVVDTIKDYCEGENVEVDKEFLLRLKEVFNTDELFKSNMINAICFPKTLKEFPIYLRPFIDTESIITDHLKVGITMMDALDINTPKIGTDSIPSNFIKI